MCDEPPLFGDDPTKPAPVAPPNSPPVSDWQVDLLRKALDGQGLTAMADRQQAIETAVGRPVESLRALTQEEAPSVLSRLGQAPVQNASGTDRKSTRLNCSH